MKLLVRNEMFGLVPLYNDDYTKKQRLKFGETYEVSIKVKRNYELHKKYFSLINTAWQYQNEATQNFFKNSVEQFRKAAEISAGHCDTVFNIKLKTWVDIPKSIAFDKMDELEFRELYDSVKNVLFAVFLKNVSEEEFMSNLSNY